MNFYHCIYDPYNPSIIRNDNISITTSTWGGVTAKPYYDPEKYDLVEKKDYKIKTLKDRIESCKYSIKTSEEYIDYHTAEILSYKNTIKAFNETIDTYTKELKELEK